MARAGNRNYTLKLPILLQYNLATMGKARFGGGARSRLLQSNIKFIQAFPLKAFCNPEGYKIASNK
jgi:hypothetical protein